MVYGIPIPQLDQMPAGLIPIYFMSEKVLGQGRKSFNVEERAKVELARYRCYLLGLPEDLLADNPTDIVRIWCTRSATLRYEYDDAICGGLLRAILRRRAAQAVPAHAGHRQRLGAEPAGVGEPRQLIATTRAQRQAIYPGRPAQRALRRQQVGEQGVDGLVNFSGHGWVDRTGLVAILASAAPCAS